MSDISVERADADNGCFIINHETGSVVYVDDADLEQTVKDLTTMLREYVL